MKKYTKYINIQHLPMFWKSLAGMFCVLLLSMIALFISSNILVDHQTEHHLEQLEKQIDYNCEDTSRQLYNIYAIPTAINGTRYYDYIRAVRGNELPLKYVSVLPLIRESLKNQVFLYGSNNECLLYLSGSNSIVTKLMAFSKAEDCFDEYIRFSDISAETILETLRDSYVVQLFPMQNVSFSSASPTRCMPLVIRPSNTSIAVMGIYSEKTILEMLGYDILPEGTYLEITDHEGNLLETYPADPSGDIKSGSHAITSQLKELKARVTFWIPQSYFTGMTRTAWRTGLLLIGLTALLGVLLSAILSDIFTKPMRSLVQTHMEEEKDGEMRMLNEVEYISHIVKQAKQGALELQQMLCAQFLTRAMAGGILSEKDSAQLTAFVLDRVSPPFRLAVFRVPESVGQTVLITLLQGYLSNDFVFQPFNDAEGGILFEGDVCHLDLFREALAQAKAGLSANEDGYQNIHVGISGLFDHIDSLHIALRQAYIAMDTKEEPGIYNGSSAIRSVTWLWHERLYQSILSNDEEGALHLLGTISKEGYYGKTGEEVFYNVLFVLRSASEEIGVTLHALETVAYNGHLSPQENISLLRHAVEELFAAMKKQQENAAHNQCDAVLSYLAEHFDDSGMCALQVAEQFGLSEKRIYSIIRSATDMSFSEYLLQLRMQRASTLLCSTSISIEEIYKMCGYPAESTFYRVFKKYYHKTPTEYRKNAGGSDLNVPQ